MTRIRLNVLDVHVCDYRRGIAHNMAEYIRKNPGLRQKFRPWGKTVVLMSMGRRIIDIVLDYDKLLALTEGTTFAQADDLISLRLIAKGKDPEPWTIERVAVKLAQRGVYLEGIEKFAKCFGEETQAEAGARDLIRDVKRHLASVSA